MGAYNFNPIFSDMTVVIQDKRQEEAGWREIQERVSCVLIDDITLFKLLLVVLLNYLEVLLEVLSHYRCMINI